MEKNVHYDKKIWDIKVITSFVIAFIFMSMGFYKMFVYETSISAGEKNVYVGGDAYNYIINANFSTAYFVLTLIFTIIACTLLICNMNMVNGNKTLR